MYTEYCSMVKFNGFMKLTQVSSKLKTGLEMILIILNGKELQLKLMVNTLTIKLNSFIKICYTKEIQIPQFHCKTQKHRHNIRLM